jgi:osmotically inducible protein OsmC
MSDLYSTRVTAVGGRQGSIRSDDGILELKLAVPVSLGGKGGATNPEQLFAGGYAACFENALLRVAREAHHRLAETDVEVTVEIGLNRNASDAFVLSGALTVTIIGLDQVTAEAIVERAHSICPYSNAIRGNVNVQTTVMVK